MFAESQARQGTKVNPASQSTVIQFPLERRKIAKKMTMAMLSWTIFFGIGFVVTAIFAAAAFTGLWVIFLAIIILYAAIFVVELWYQTEYFKKYFYNITPDFLIIKKGVITPHETMLPYEKLQDVYMDQDIFDRMFDLWDVHVSTATAMSGSEAHIDGVNRGNGEKIREIILSKIRRPGR
jgi:membrane protein YdbS with pleckstrin-like domain